MQKVLVVCPNPAIDIYTRVEKFDFGIPNRVLKEDRYPGGKGLHMAMALAEIKITVVAGFGEEKVVAGSKKDTTNTTLKSPS